MNLNKWSIKYYTGWDKYFKKFDEKTKIIILKKIEKMKQDLKQRKLHKSVYLVEKLGNIE
jgi:hypothetical protein